MKEGYGGDAERFSRSRSTDSAIARSCHAKCQIKWCSPHWTPSNGAFLAVMVMRSLGEN
jgi:hypothetical protein